MCFWPWKSLLPDVCWASVLWQRWKKLSKMGAQLLEHVAGGVKTFERRQALNRWLPQHAFLTLSARSLYCFVPVPRTG